MEHKKEIYNEFVKNLAGELQEALEEREFSDLIFLCIGTDKITGDSFGPLVGYKLETLYKYEGNVHVIGSLGNLVSAKNINDIMTSIVRNYEAPFIIAIDSAVARQNMIGKIIVTSGGMSLGSGLNKKNIKVGDISIKGIVSRNTGIPKQNFTLLQNTSLNLVMNMAENTANRNI